MDDHDNTTAGTTYRKPFRDLDPRRLPSAPPRLGEGPAPAVSQVAAHAATHPSAVPTLVTKSHQVVEWLWKYATHIEDSKKPSQIGAALGIDGNTVSALLAAMSKRKTGGMDRLKHIQRGNTKYWWWQEYDAEPEEHTLEVIDPPSDPVVAGINALQRAAIPDAAKHAARLRAMAESPILDGSVAAWLAELADLVEGAA